MRSVTPETALMVKADMLKGSTYKQVCQKYGITMYRAQKIRAGRAVVVKERRAYLLPVPAYRCPLCGVENNCRVEADDRICPECKSKIV